MTKYYIFNTNASRLSGDNDGTAIYEKGVVATYGPKDEFGVLLDSLTRGDTIISYLNEVGAKAYGKVTETWDGQNVTDPEQKVDHNDRGEYHVDVNWRVILDDDDAIEYSEILDILGWDPETPLNATRNPISDDESGEKLVDEVKDRLHRRGGRFGQSRIQPIPESLDFNIGDRYSRWDLHQKHGGQPYTGISTPAERDAIFLFTGDSGAEFGYEDHFKSDGTFVYTGEGQTGDMDFSGGNKAIRDHHDNNERLLLFEDTDLPWIVSFVGAYQYDSHRIDTLPDKDKNQRKAIRFELVPEGGRDIEIEEESREPDLEEIYQRAQQSAPEQSDTKESPTSSTTKRYSRAEEVKKFALAAASGVCQGCDQEAPFTGQDGEPFLEVHHMKRRSDGGADKPENVIALCPNCHRRVHSGIDGDEFNQRLIEKASQRDI